MSKKTELNNNIKWAVIASTALHVLLFIVIVWSSFNKYIRPLSNNDKSTIDAIMINPNAIVQNYNNQQQQQVEKLHKKKQPIEQKILKQLKKEHLQIQKLVHEREQQKEVKKKKEITNTEEKGEVVAAKKIVQKENKKTPSKKIREAAAIEQKSTVKKVITNNIDDILNNLTLSNSAIKTNNSIKDNDVSSVRNDNIKNNEVSSDDISNYTKKIKSAIENCFYNSIIYSGKICTLRIKLAPEGTLLDIKSDGGDPVLCAAALAAARQAKIPKPPSQAVYEVFKNISLNFKP